MSAADEIFIVDENGNPVPEELPELEEYVTSDEEDKSEDLADKEEADAALLDEEDDENDPEFLPGQECEDSDSEDAAEHAVCLRLAQEIDALLVIDPELKPRVEPAERLELLLTAIQECYEHEH